MIHFFPSATLSRYVARMFLVRVVAFLLGLVLILQTLDLLSESDKILGVPANDYADLLHYVTLRMPQLIAQFLPFSVLLATLVTLATLNQSSEVVIMKAAGLSAHQILMPLIAVGLGTALVHFSFAEAVVIRTTANLRAWEEAGYVKGVRTEGSGQEVWVSDGGTIIHARRAFVDKGTLILPQFQLYERNDGPNLSGIVIADQAVLRHRQWTLINAQHFNVDGKLLKQQPTESWNTNIGASRFLAIAVDPNTVTYRALRQAIHELAQNGHPVGSLKAALYHKIAGPLSSMLMPILGAVAAFGVLRSGRLFIRIVIGMLLGFAYFVADNFMMAMGQFGSVPPILAAWAAPLLFLCVGESVLFRTEE